jgi:hypothetical protein
MRSTLIHILVFYKNNEVSNLYSKTKFMSHAMELWVKIIECKLKHETTMSQLNWFYAKMI